jgi:phospholipid/cholesterol/gamma-HCH transport system substrate-binding protein
VRDLRATSANVAQLSAAFKSTNARLDSLLAKVENGNGTAARLLNDPGLYNDVRGLVSRLDSLSADFKKNPRRYVNLRVF